MDLQNSIPNLDSANHISLKASSTDVRIHRTELDTEQTYHQNNFIQSDELIEAYNYLDEIGKYKIRRIIVSHLNNIIRGLKSVGKSTHLFKDTGHLSMIHDSMIYDIFNFFQSY